MWTLGNLVKYYTLLFFDLICNTFISSILKKTFVEANMITFHMRSNICLKQPLKNCQNKDLNDKIELNGGRKMQNAPFGAFSNTFDLH